VSLLDQRLTDYPPRSQSFIARQQQGRLAGLDLQLPSRHLSRDCHRPFSQVRGIPSPSGPEDTI
jgi:hypothetical protein